MVHLEIVEDPFNAFYLESFSCINEEQNFKDALKFKSNITNNILSNKRIEAFQYHEYSFITCLLIDEKHSWLGYIDLYNDIFVKQQLQRFLKLSMPLLKEMAVKHYTAKKYLEKFKSQKCLSFDISQVTQLIFSNYLNCGGNEDNLNAYFLECQKLLSERPEELFIEFALYEWLTIFPEDINELLEQFYKILENDSFFSDINIIIKGEKNDYILNESKYKEENIGEFKYFYLKSNKKTQNHTKALSKQKKHR